MLSPLPSSNLHLPTMPTLSPFPPAHNAHPLTISTCPQCPPSHPSLQTAGLGGMKPNTLVLGFYSQDLPINTLDTLHRKLLRKSKVLQYIFREKPLEKFDCVNRELPSLRTNVCEWLCADQYDCLCNSNLCVAVGGTGVGC